MILVALTAVVGLLVGSFLNVVIWRVPRGESVVSPRSRCPNCGHEIRGRDNVPILSWLLLHARCRDCGARVSARYPLVELATAVLFGLLAWHFGLHVVLIAYLYLAAISIALALIDIDLHKLPDALTLAVVSGGCRVAHRGRPDGTRALRPCSGGDRRSGAVRALRRAVVRLSEGYGSRRRQAGRRPWHVPGLPGLGHARCRGILRVRTWRSGRHHA